jgi:hypothetical protein
MSEFERQHQPRLLTQMVIGMKIEKTNLVPLVFMYHPQCARTSIASSLLKIATPKMFTRSGLDYCLFGAFYDFDSLEDQVRWFYSTIELLKARIISL